MIFLLVARAQVVGGVALAEAGQVEGDGADAACAERPQVAAEHVGRRAERGAVQQDRRHAAAFFEIADVQSIDRDEPVVAPHRDVHHGTLLSKR